MCTTPLIREEVSEDRCRFLEHVQDRPPYAHARTSARACIDRCISYILCELQLSNLLCDDVCEMVHSITDYSYNVSATLPTPEGQFTICCLFVCVLM